MPIYWIWFAGLKGLNLTAKRQLLETYGDPEILYRMDGETLPGELADVLGQKDLSAARQIYNNCLSKHICILTYADASYPQRLRAIEDPPMVLYYVGTLPQWQAQPVIGVVGTRKASPYGLRTARLLASQIAACGGLVVSGAATGVDTESMDGAMDAGKTTVGVLGGGVDVVYPASNRGLYRRTEEKGCLISEYPPGARPYPGNFLQRNRIISGISEGILVVEAPEKSGALNTARHALTQGRDLFVVPGNLGVDTCLGSNALLQEGAYAALSGWDVVKHYAPLYPDTVANRPAAVEKREEMPLPRVAQSPALPKSQAAPAQGSGKKPIDNPLESTYSVINKRPANLSDQEQGILALLRPEPCTIDSILDASDLPFGTVQSILTRLAIKGLAYQHPDGRISLK